MKMQFWSSTLQQLKVENVIFIWQEGTISRAVQTVLVLQEVRFFFFRFLIMSCKKLYREQPVAFLIIVLIIKFPIEL